MGKYIEQVDSHLYLLHWFPNNLHLMADINDIAVKVRKKLNLATPLKMNVDCKSMEYANIVWGGSYDSDILMLENIYLDAMQLVTDSTARNNIINVHDQFGGYNVSGHIKQTTLTMLFKVIRGRTPQYIVSLK